MLTVLKSTPSRGQPAVCPFQSSQDAVTSEAPPVHQKALALSHFFQGTMFTIPGEPLPTDHKVGTWSELRASCLPPRLKRFCILLERLCPCMSTEHQFGGLALLEPLPMTPSFHIFQTSQQESFTLRRYDHSPRPWKRTQPSLGCTVYRLTPNCSFRTWCTTEH